MRGTYFQEYHLLTAAEAATDWDRLSGSTLGGLTPALTVGGMPTSVGDMGSEQI